MLLVQQLPAKPAYLRVKIWRQLQSLGVVSLKNSVFVLPETEQTRVDFQRLLSEIEREGGEGLICRAEFLAGIRDVQVRALFNAARDADYGAIAKDLRAFSQTLRKAKNRKADLGPALIKFRQRFMDASRIDYFGAPGRLPVEASLAALEHRPITKAPGSAKSGAIDPKALTARAWVTRQDIHVDRIACAWLIKRFVDPKGTLKFVSSNDYKPLPGELRFDMQDGEFTHEGDNCSFETILKRAGVSNPALKAIGEIIHDIDLKDGKFNRPETAGIAHVIAGICRTQGEDEARVMRGNELFDDTYEQFRRGGGKGRVRG
ncbi:MAG: chromate resistance protein [Alphaproteobacteria bacterium]|nr:chromate resistance protein [Alphaproteobacteria bacterium]